MPNEQSNGTACPTTQPKKNHGACRSEGKTPINLRRPPVRNGGKFPGRSKNLHATLKEQAKQRYRKGRGTQCTTNSRQQGATTTSSNVAGGGVPPNAPRSQPGTVAREAKRSALLHACPNKAPRGCARCHTPQGEGAPPARSEDPAIRVTAHHSTAAKHRASHANQGSMCQRAPMATQNS